MKILFIVGLSLLLGGLLCLGGSFVFVSAEIILILVGIIATLAGFGLLILFGFLHKLRGVHEFAMDVRDAYRDAQNDRRNNF